MTSSAIVPRESRDYLGIIATIVIAGSFVVRLIMAADQSYWSDELFSVQQSSVDGQRVLEVGATEVHTPLFAAVLFSWMKLGQLMGTSGTGETWTHFLSLIVVAMGVLGAWSGLRKAGVSKPGLWSALAAVSLSGFTLTYSLETRAYGLMLAGALGSTAFSLAVSRQLTSNKAVSWWPWTAWALLASTAHLFGALLVVGQALVIVATVPSKRRSGIAWPTIRSVIIAVSLQLAWIALGALRTDGFAGGTAWIPAPTPKSIWILFTSSFSSGDLVHEAGGFTWYSSNGVIVVIALVVVTLLVRIVSNRKRLEDQRTKVLARDDVSPVRRSVGEGNAVRLGDVDGRAAVFFGLITVLLVGGALLGSQTVHIWTLRNMLVVLPALVWFVSFGLIRLASRTTPKAIVGWLIVGACVVGGATSLVAMSHPYKQDYRAFAEYLLKVHEEDPNTKVRAQGGPEYLALAAQKPIELFEQLSGWEGSQGIPHGPIVDFKVSRGGEAQTERAAKALISKMGRSDCEIVPIVEIAVIHCGRTWEQGDTSDH